MEEKALQDFFKKREQILFKYIVYPVIVGVVIMISGAVWMYFAKIQMNTVAIKLLDAAKVNNEDFNAFIKIQNEINVLQEERVKVLNETSIKQEGVNKELLDKLHLLDIQIEILKEKNKKILSTYGMVTRANSTISVGLEFMYQDSISSKILTCK